MLRKVLMTLAALVAISLAFAPREASANYAGSAALAARQALDSKVEPAYHYRRYYVRRYYRPRRYYVRRYYRPRRFYVRRYYY